MNTKDVGGLLLCYGMTVDFFYKTYFVALVYYLRLEMYKRN